MRWAPPASLTLLLSLAFLSPAAAQEDGEFSEWGFSESLSRAFDEAWPPEFDAVLAGQRAIREGERGHHVEVLQKLLAATGSPCGADGDFGPQTLLAVISFQRRQRLTQDGVVGKQTLSTLLGRWRTERESGSEPAATEPPADADESARYDALRRVIIANGGTFADEALEVTILGVRENPTGGAAGLRCYKDTFYLLWRDEAGRKHVSTFTGSTYPGQTHTSGVPDLDGDGVPDVAWLRPGCYEFSRGWYKGKRALRTIESHLPCDRDFDHDGQISAAERLRAIRRGATATGILFHEGLDDRPSSIGCQNLPPGDFDRFMDIVDTDRQRRVHYTLIER